VAKLWHQDAVNSVLMLVNMVTIWSPRRPTVAAIVTPMPATMRPYSMAVGRGDPEGGGRRS